MRDSDTRKWLAMIGGLMGMMLVANAALLFVALRNPPDPEPDAYARSLRWDETSAARARSRALGWQTTVEVFGGEAALHTIEVQVRDRLGAPIQLDRGNVRLVRPSNSSLAQTLPLASRGDGKYVAVVVIPEKGLWQLDLELVRGADLFLGSIRKDIY